MKFLVIKAPVFVNVIIAIISSAVSGFTLLFGIAHMFEESNTDIPESEQYLGVAMVALLCVLGIVFLIVTIAAIRGIISKIRQK